MDANGRFLSQSAHEKELLEAKRLRRRSELELALTAESGPTGNEAFRQCMRIKDGQKDVPRLDLGGYADYRGIDVLGAWEPVEGTGWFCIAEVERDYAIGPLNRLLRTLMGTVGGVFILVFVLVSFLSARLVRPLEKLTLAAARLAAGDRSARCEMRRSDEIGQLSSAFDSMAAAIERTLQGLTASEGEARQLAKQAQEAAKALELQVAERVKAEQEQRLATTELKKQSALLVEKDWLKTNVAKMTTLLQGVQDLRHAASVVIRELTPLVSGVVGAFYLMEEEDGQPVLTLQGSYAYLRRKNLSNRFRLGHGLVGQCALEGKPFVLTNVPADYMGVSTGLVEFSPKFIMVSPVMFEGRCRAVIELATIREFTPAQGALLGLICETLGIVLENIGSRMKTEKLLDESRRLACRMQEQSEELQSQQEELRETNQTLEAQTQALQSSEEVLRAQQGELQEANRQLEQNSSQLEQKNREVEEARVELEAKAGQLTLSSKYKSEFLVNMSHELRTPLNSMLILSKMLADNKEGNLTGKQIDFARTVHSSGADLLNLINDILDLSKIEAGKMSIEVSTVAVRDVCAAMQRSFGPVAQTRGVEFRIDIGPGVPDIVKTDDMRLQQVLKNLLSNAFKFTSKGCVALEIRTAESGPRHGTEGLQRARSVVAFGVRDSGIGITKDKMELIFEAFQQADGSTSRKFGGTGLGLSISREIMKLLGGKLTLESQPDVGSVFTAWLPDSFVATAKPAQESSRISTGAVSAPAASFSTTGPAPGLSRPGQEVAVHVASAPSRRAADQTPEPEDESGDAARAPLEHEGVPDDRNALKADDRVLLIVEDDPTFASVLLDVARQRGFKGLVALRGDTGLALARHFMPDGIVLDLGLPVVDGYTVLEKLKLHADTRHIPVHIVSGQDDRHKGLRLGAIEHLVKPATHEDLVHLFERLQGFMDCPARNLLLIEDDPVQQLNVRELIGGGDVTVTAVGTGADALNELSSRPYDCVVLDLGLPDMTGFDLLERMASRADIPKLPIVVYTARDLTEDEELQIRKYTKTIILKEATSMDRLLDETTLFLHQVEAKLPEPKRAILKQLHSGRGALAGRKILVVDDDARNIFALTSVLEDHEVNVIHARNGRDGIEVLKKNPDTDLLLLDIMMPEMDGYETARAIRALPEFRPLPIIALTAKAMQGDREKCLQAGASDYISKPVDTDKLISLLRVWLYGSRVN